jgi:glyoxylase-like metal-dependent hydrolase (beta-lactamase superfamily II)
MIPIFSVHAIRVGTIVVQKSATVQGAAPGTIEVPVWTAAIEGNGYRVLVDTGMKHPERWSKLAPHSLDEGETLDGRLSELGWRTKDVDIVINTHLHYDHAENNLSFPDAQFYVSQAEWDCAADPVSNQIPMYDIDWTGRDLTFMNYTLVATDNYDVVPGIRIIQTPGHTPGHQSVLVNTAEGVLCVTGDAVCVMDNLKIPAPPGVHISSRASLESIDKIARLADRIMPSHDPLITQFQNSSFPTATRAVHAFND